MNIVALVPIKLNSQRLPHKNILPLAGHPLCWHICNTLEQIKEINKSYVFCSDPLVKKYIPSSVSFLQRDADLDGDKIKGFEIYQRFIELIDADVYVLAHTTSPFIKAESIRKALNKVTCENFDSAFSAQRIQTFAWYQNKPINYNINDVPRTQDIEPIFIETSAFFIFKKEVFTEHRRRIGFNPYIQEVSDLEAIDIDEQKDYELALKLVR